MEIIPQLSFSEAFNSATSKIFQFTGRSRRSEYWWTMAVVYLIYIILTPIFGFILSITTIPLTFRRLHDTGRSGWWWGVGAIIKVLFLVSIIYNVVMLGTHFTNFYDIEESFAATFASKYLIWLLFLLIVIHKIMMLVFMCIDSDDYENEYGESPKYIDELS